MTAPLVWFYPHGVLRERQLDVIRGWPRGRVLNPELAMQAPGALAGAGMGPAARRTGLLGRLPLPNVKRRPSALPPDSAIYVFGGVVDRGPFVVDLDTPYALTGYNLAALPLWRSLLRRMLLSPRCLAIRCMSEACRRSLILEFGLATGAKSEVHYPQIAQAPAAQPPRASREAWDSPRFLFVGSQFEIKGGAALLRAFKEVHAAVPTACLDIVTHLPDARFALAEQPGVAVHPANLDRAALWQRLFSQADVLVLPTFVESFGMVALEALAHGLAVIATDLYALPEMVKDGVNGALIHAPLSVWDGYRPGPLSRALDTVPEAAARLETTAFELELAAAMIQLCDRATLASAQKASRLLYEEHFVR